MQEEGVIVKIEGGTAIVETVPSKECKGCGVCASARPRKLRVKVDKKYAFKSGDRIYFEVPSGAMLKIYLFLYGIPLVSFLSVILLAYALTGSPVKSFAASVLSLIVTYIYVGKYIEKKAEFTPSICPRK